MTTWREQREYLDEECGRRARLAGPLRDEEARAVEALVSGRVFILRLDVLCYWIWFKCNPANDNYGGPYVDREE